MLVAVFVLTAPSRAGTWHELRGIGHGRDLRARGLCDVDAAGVAVVAVADGRASTAGFDFVLGPLTLVRPFVIIGALVAACVVTNEPRVWIVGASAGICMLAMEHVLSRRYAEAWRRLVA